MKFGIAKDLITPPLKTHMGGYGSLYGKDFVGVHDDLYVKTLLLDDGRQKIVLMTCDLLMHGYELTETISEYIESRHGIPRGNLVLSYTHSHAGPALEGYDPGQASPEYESFLLDRMKNCIDRACVNVVEGRMEFGSVEGDWNISRRLIVNGQMCSAPNLSGNKDRTINILKLSDTAGQCKALLLNYSCHPVTLADTLWISAEFPGRLCQILDTHFYGCTTMFFQGAGGNTRPLIAAGPNNTWKCCSFEEVDGMASAMAISVRNAMDCGKLQPVTPDLAARQFLVTLETEVYPKEFFQKVLDAQGPAATPSSKNEARVVLERYDRTDNTVPLHAAIIRLGEGLYVASLCGEVCLEVKQEVAKVFAGKRLIFVGYCDGTAYIPDDKLIDEGGYEVDGSVVEFCLKGRLKKGINAKLREAYGTNLRRLEEERQA
jgi:neutral ceramidase